MTNKYNLSDDQINLLVERYNQKTVEDTAPGMAKWAREVHGMPLAAAYGVFRDMESASTDYYMETVPYVELRCCFCSTITRLKLDEHQLDLMQRTFTFDCDNMFCGQSLLYEDCKVQGLHKAIHATTPEWPEDGKGIMSVDL